MASYLSYQLAQEPQVGQSPLIHEISRSHTTTQHSRQDSSRRVISSSQRPLPDNTQHSQQRDIHAPVGIRTHNCSRRSATHLHLRPRSHWDRHRASYIEDSSSQIDRLGQGCTNPGHQVTVATIFRKASPNIHGSSVWNLLLLTLLAPREVASRFMENFCTPALGYRVDYI